MMKYFRIKVFLIALTVSFVACNSPKSSSEVHDTVHTIVRAPDEKGSAHKYLNQDSVKINGMVKFVDRYQNAVDKLGKPDSLFNPDMNDISVSYFNSRFQVCYIKGVAFEKHSDTMVMSSIDLQKYPQNYLSAAHLKLNNTISLDSAKRLFPTAMMDTMNVYKLGKFKVLSIPVAKKERENRWLLFFDMKASKLAKIEYWMAN